MFSKADTHMHTTCSDGLVSPEELVDYVAAQTDLRIIAVTDHDTAEGGLRAQEYARRQGLSLEVIVGQEVTTDEGDIVGLFVHTTMPAFRTAREAVDAIHAQGGLAVAVHPYSRLATGFQMKGVADLIGTLPLDGVEVRNGFPSNILANAMSVRRNRRGQRLSELGGSDSHVPYTVGQAHTLFRGATAEELRHAIIRRETRAAGPLWLPASMAKLTPVLLRKGFPSRAQEPVRGQTTAFEVGD